MITFNASRLGTQSRQVRIIVRLLTMLALGFVNAGSCCAAQTNSASAQIDALFSGIEGKELPGAAVLVMRNGQVIHSKAYGLANIESRTPNTTHTRFRIASITKSFTALAILRLAEEGRLSLDDPASKYLPDLNGGDRIKIRHLLTHTAGMPDFMSFDDGKKLPRECQPGERLNYSNLGYIALGRIIEKVSGTNYEAYLRATVFSPLGMKTSGVDRNGSGPKDRASGYCLDGQGKVAPAQYTESGNDPQAGGLASSVEEMAVWLKALTTGKLISKTMLAEATTPVRLNDGRQGVYGDGFMLIPFHGLKEVAHGGDISGFNTYFAYYPDADLAVVVLSNIGLQPPGPVPAAGDITHRIVEILIPEKLGPANPEPVQVSAAVLERYVGKYRIAAPERVLAVMGDRLEISREGEHLFGAGKQGKAELFAESTTMFYAKGTPVKITFSTNANGSGVLSLLGLREFALQRQ